MGRPARFIPENKNGVLVEVTCRTIGARALLVPSPNPSTFNEVVVGVIGRALEVSPLELCSMVWTANHWHGLCVVRDQQQLSRFMHHVQLSSRICGQPGAQAHQQTHLSSAPLEAARTRVSGSLNAFDSSQF